MISYFSNANRIARIDSKSKQPVASLIDSVATSLGHVQSLIALEHVQNNCALPF